MLTLSASPDATPPVITYTISGTKGNNGWYTSAVDAHLDCNG